MKKYCLVFLISLLTSCYARVPEKTGLEGKPIPHFTILCSDSTTYYNTEHIDSGKPTVIIYFSPDCVFSRTQTQDIVDNIDRMKSINFYFVTTADFHSMKKFSNDFKLFKYPNITVGYDYTHFVGDYFEASGFPYIAIYGKNIKLTAVFEGIVSARQIKNCAEG